MSLHAAGDYAPNKSKKESVLLEFSTDITKLATDGKLDPVIGRDEETERVAQILSRRRKNNPVIIGEPGCVFGDTEITVKKISNDTEYDIIEI